VRTRTLSTPRAGAFARTGKFIGMIRTRRAALPQSTERFSFRTNAKRCPKTTTHLRSSDGSVL